MIWNVVFLLSAAAVATLATGCGDDGAPPPGGDVDAGEPPGDGGGGGDDGGPGDPGDPLARASTSSTIDITGDDAVVVMTNPEDGSVSSFNTADNSMLARIPTGPGPSSVVIHPNGTTAFVANRGDATVVRIEGIDTAAAEVTGSVDVGSEPTGLALSPTGARLFVAEHAEGSVGIIDTATLTRTDSIDAPNAPFAIGVTNDLDTEDDDELLIVPEFFGEPTADGEATDTSRSGRVRIYQLSDLAPTDPIVLDAVDSGFAPEGGSTVMTSPNQLWSFAIQNGKLYIPSTSVSPAAPVRFNLNVHPVVYVADLESRTQDVGAEGTVNLARAVKDAAGTDPIQFLADTVDIAFIGDSGIAYAVSRGSDTMQRVVFEDGAISVGSDRNLQIELLAPPAGASAGCQNPTGVATAHGAPRAYVNCWVSRRLGVVDLSTQSLATTIEASSPPMGEEVEVARGRRFFFTGRARWSSEGWSSCSSCHPGGLTDNVTWAFPAGPRQATSLDGSFSHGDGAQVQRVFNWTGIFDELHDFERNTRGVSGGLGAITTGGCGDLGAEVQTALVGNLATPLKELQDQPGACTQDWDAIDAWVRTVRPPRARRFVDADSVARGAELFGMPDASNNNGGCVACHGGAGWTVSRRFWTPSTANNTALASTPFAAPSGWAPSWSHHDTQIAPQPASADTTGAVAAPPQVACVLRDVGTFGSDEVEVRANGARAQGAGGYNIPSLYGLAVGAPYLHHGGAATLEDLLNDPQWASHLTAANPVFLTTGDADEQKRDLINFLLSIDSSTPEQAIPSGMDGCPTSFP